MTFHRTQGDTRDCRGCRYWSEMIAQAFALEVKAMCLAPDAAPRRMQYVGARETCTSWKSGHLGAVDDPSPDPLPLEYLRGTDT